MRRIIGPLFAAAAGVPFVIVACSSSLSSPTATPEGDAAPVANVTFQKDVRALIDSKCVSCHTTGGIAPFTLGSYAEAKTHAAAIKAAVTSRIMPPWLATKGCTEYQSDPSLTDAEIARVASWVDSGAVEGNETDFVKPVEVTVPTLSRVDLHLPIPVAYVPKLSPDEYRCFMIELPDNSKTQYVTGFRANAGNPAIVHHAIAYVAEPSALAEYAALEAQDPEPGWTCFGGPGGDIKTPWLSGWAPGSPGGDFPAGTGIKIAAGSKIVLQIHYNLLNQPNPTPDQTSIDLMTADSVEKEGHILRFTDFLGWVQGHHMDIPANATDVVHSYELDPSPYLDLLTQSVFKNGKPITLYSSNMHMHTRGTKAHVSIERANGESECALNVDQWNFHWQMSYAFTQPKTLSPGDQLRLECHWDNSPANQPLQNGSPMPVRDVNWGEGTGDEMCLTTFYATQ